jgi:hypothetical protein
LPGLTKTDLNNIDTNSKIISIVNILNASLIDNMPLNSIQVRLFKIDLKFKDELIITKYRNGWLIRLW